MVTLTLGFLMAIVLTEYTAASIPTRHLDYGHYRHIFCDVRLRLAAVVPQNLSDLHDRTGHYDYHRASHDVSGIPSGWNDWVVIVIFCGLIGYDFYQARHRRADS